MDKKDEKTAKSQRKRRLSEPVDKDYSEGEPGLERDSLKVKYDKEQTSGQPGERELVSGGNALTPTGTLEGRVAVAEKKLSDLTEEQVYTLAKSLVDSIEYVAWYEYMVDSDTKRLERYEKQLRRERVAYQRLLAEQEDRIADAKEKIVDTKTAIKSHSYNKAFYLRDAEDFRERLVQLKKMNGLPVPLIPVEGWEDMDLEKLAKAKALEEVSKALADEGQVDE
ncbi:MAG: hypothetical protein QNJ68_09800 [Microcoleaceae cyanobacterium MO_207.B10]|nr:hypothetical protein [Microcoleaceae cyanobacterium MO_207.B10]